MLYAFAFLTVAFLLVGYFSPSSIPGKFVWGTLDSLNLAGDNYKARHAIANYRGAVGRKATTLGSGIEHAGNYQALIASATREKTQKLEEAEELEAKLDLLDGEGCPDDSPQKLRLGEQLIEVQARLERIDAALARYGATKESTRRLLVTAKDDVLKGRKRARELEQDYHASRTEAELARQASAFSPDGHDTMDEAERLVQGQIDANRGRAAAFQDVLGVSDEDRSLDARLTARKTADFLKARRANKSPSL